MVDPDLLDTNPLARQGLKLLVESGILRHQLGRLLERVTAGDSAQNDSDLLKAIKEYRIQSGYVAALQELGEQIKDEENRNESR